MQCLNNNSTAVLYSHILNNKYIYTRNPSMHFCIITVLQNLGGMKTELCLYAAQKLQYSYFVNNDVVVSEPKTKTGYRHETQYRTQGNFVGINTFFNLFFMVSFIFSLYFLFLDVNKHKRLYPKKDFCGLSNDLFYDRFETFRRKLISVTNCSCLLSLLVGTLVKIIK